MIKCAPSCRRQWRPRVSLLASLLLASLAFWARSAQGQVNVTFNAATDIAITAASYDGTGQTLNVTLNFTPAPGTNLTVVRNTGLSFIAGAFTNVANGATVSLGYNGINYPFVAWYYGGAGRDLVLLWPTTLLAAWGDGDSGDLGNYEVPANGYGFGPQYAPVAVDRLGAFATKTVVQVACGQNHTLALTSDGLVYAWGDNYYGELGNGESFGYGIRDNEPGQVTTASALAGKTVIAVAAGDSYSLALCSDGTVAAWGWDEFDQLGIGGFHNGFTVSPTAVNTMTDPTTGAPSALAGKMVVGISAGSLHSLAVCSDGTVAAWGNNSFGELGNNDVTGAARSVPAAVSMASNVSALYGKTVTAVSAGADFSLALCSDGTVAAWGFNQYGALGNNDSNETTQYAPVAVSTLGGVSALSGRTVAAISAGASFSLALCTDGSVVAWGYNGDGELGNNDATGATQRAPVLVNTAGGTSALSGKTVVAISAGSGASLALCSDGTVASWGSDKYAQLGNNDNVNGATRYAPVAVSTATVSALFNTTVNGLSQGSQADHFVVRDTVLHPPPTVTINSVTNLTVTSATLNATINPNGSATTAQFQTTVLYQFGPTELFEGATAITPNSNASITAITLNPNDGSTPQNVSAVITGLTPGIEYDVRVTATNVGGTTTGADLSFATVQPPLVQAIFNSAFDTPITASGYDATGSTLEVTLNFAPSPGTNLTVIHNTGTSFINGTFSNVANGATVNLFYNGIDYSYIAWYYGGAGRDLVLLWPTTFLAAWGFGEHGELGNDSTGRAPQFAPVPVDQNGVLAGKTVAQIARGGSHTLALTTDGAVYAWGGNAYGQLGNNDLSGADQPAPVAVNTASGVSALFDKTVIAISAGDRHSLALCSDGTVVAWGDNYLGQLGLASLPGGSWDVPVAVNATAGESALFGQTVTGIAAGGYHNLALCSDGTVVAWGSNGNGQLGTNELPGEVYPAPAAVSIASGTSALFGKSVTAIAAGAYHSLALCSDGTAAAWGSNGYCQLGVGLAGDQPAPTAVYAEVALSGKTVIAIAAGLRHSLALCSDGTLTAWGDNYLGQLGINFPPGGEDEVPTYVDTYGLLYGKRVVEIAAGADFSLARCSDGTIASWGTDAGGELGINDPSGATAFAPVMVNLSADSTTLAGGFVTGLSAGSQAAHSVVICAPPPIQLAESTGPILASGVSTVSFGTLRLGQSSTATFTIHNTSGQSLTSLTAQSVGPNSSEYLVGALGKTYLSSGETTSFPILFIPSGYGGRVATLQVSSDQFGSSVEIGLAGVGAIPASISEVQFYPSIAGTFDAVNEYTITTTDLTGTHTEAGRQEGAIVISQNGDSFSFLPSTGIDAGVLRTGILTGNQLTLAGLAASPRGLPGLIINTNQYNATGTVSADQIVIKGHGELALHKGRLPKKIVTSETLTLKGALTPNDVLPLALEVSPAGAGKISGAGAYQAETEVTLTAHPAAGYYFAAWTENGNYVSDSAVYTLSSSDNGTLAANFARIQAAHYAGAIESLTNAAGSFRASLAATGAFTAKLSFSGAAYAVSGTFGANLEISRLLKGPNRSEYFLDIYLYPITGLLGGQITDADGTLLDTFSGEPASLIPTPLAGQYTVRVQPVATAETPARSQGDGFANLVVQPLGAVTACGKLADGTAFSAGGSLVNGSVYPLYSTLSSPAPGGRGNLSGNLVFQGTGAATDSVSGTLSWRQDQAATSGDGRRNATTLLPVVGQRATLPATPVQP